MLAHHPPRPPGVAPAPAIPPGRVSSAASRRRRTRWPTAWPSGCSASPSKTGTSPVTARRGLPARDCWMGVTPQRRGRWGCTSPSSPMPIEACRDGGSLPAMDSTAGSASALRWPWCNRKRASDMRNRERAHRNAVPVHEHPDMRCACADRHRERRKRRQVTAARPKIGKAPARKADGLVSGPIFGDDPTRFEPLLLAETASLRDLSFAQIVQSINREESNDGTHETKSALLRRR